MDFQGVEYVLNKCIFIVTVGLSYFVGLKVAARTVVKRKEFRKEYYSIVLSFPVGLLFGYFNVDILFGSIGSRLGYSLPVIMIFYWLCVIFAGAIVSMFISLYMVKVYKNKEEDRGTTFNN